MIILARTACIVRDMKSDGGHVTTPLLQHACVCLFHPGGPFGMCMDITAKFEMRDGTATNSNSGCSNAAVIEVGALYTTSKTLLK